MLSFVLDRAFPVKYSDTLPPNVKRVTTAYCTGPDAPSTCWYHSPGVYGDEFGILWPASSKSRAYRGKRTPFAGYYRESRSLYSQRVRSVGVFTYSTLGRCGRSRDISHDGPSYDSTVFKVTFRFRRNRFRVSFRRLVRTEIERVD